MNDPSPANVQHPRPWVPAGFHRAAGNCVGILRISLARNTREPDSYCALIPGTHLLIGAVARRVVCWDLETRVKQWHQYDNQGKIRPKVAVSPDSRLLVVGFSYNGGWSLRNLETGTLQHQGQEKGHIQGVDWSADSRRFFTLTFHPGNNLAIWNAETGKQIARCTVGTTFTNALSVSPDGALVAIGDMFGFVTLYDARTLQQIRQARASREIEQKITSEINHLAFSPDSRHLLVTYTNGRVLVLNTGDGTTQAINQHVGQVVAGDWLSDGSRVATVSLSGSRSLKVWDAHTGDTVQDWETTQTLDDLIKDSHDLNASSLSWSSDGGFIALAHASGDVSLWNTRPLLSPASSPTAPPHPATVPARIRTVENASAAIASRWIPTHLPHARGRCLGVLEMEGRGERDNVGFACLVPGTRFLAGAVGATVACWDLETGEKRWQKRDEIWTAFPRVAASPDGRLLIAGSPRGGCWRLHDVETGAIRYVGTLEGNIHRIGWFRDSRRFYTLEISLERGHRNNLSAWSAENGARIKTITAGVSNTNALSVSPDGALVAVGDFNGFVTLYNARTLRKVHQARATQVTGDEIFTRIWHLAFSPDSRRLLVTHDQGTAVILNVGDFTTQAVHQHTKSAYAGDWLGDGSCIATVDWSNSCPITIWDAHNGDTIYQWETMQALTDITGSGRFLNARSLSWSPEGGFLVVAHESGQFSLWDTRDLISGFIHPGR